MAQLAAPSLTRDTLASMIRARPDLTLAALAELGPTLLSRVRIGDLIAEGPSAELPVTPAELAKAERLQGPEFDAFVLELIRAAGQEVGASYIRARAGGPRWKLQASLGRLVADGQLTRRGKTSTTRYRFAMLEHG